MRVLLVDDDPDTRAISRTIFEASGHEAMECGDGNSALRIAREHAPDAILMDMQVPGMDGWETTRALREDPATARIPVIALSAHGLAEHRTRARDAGCVAYLVKPVEPKAVVRVVEKVVHDREGR